MCSPSIFQRPTNVPELNTYTAQLDLEVGDVGMTFRRGAKWAGMQKGDRIILTIGQGHPRQTVGEAEVVQARQMRFCDIPVGFFEKCHTKNKTYDTVLAAMRRAYGQEFNPFEVVTIVEYRRVL